MDLSSAAAAHEDNSAQPIRGSPYLAADRVYITLGYMTADLIETPVLEQMANHDGDIPWHRAGDCCSPRRGQVAHDWRLQARDEAHVVILGHAY